MKFTLCQRLLVLMVACLMLVSGRNLLADPSPAAVLLVQAYHTLEQADHDYKGHRIDAMKQIEAAGKLLGVKTKGDGKAHEAQGVSDDQLRVAQGLLQQALPGLSGKPLQHVNNALKQISIALGIK